MTEGLWRPEPRVRTSCQGRIDNEPGGITPHPEHCNQELRAGGNEAVWGIGACPRPARARDGTRRRRGLTTVRCIDTVVTH